jgi:hypothetical protein
MHCPNYPTCQLIHIPGFVESETLRESYEKDFCNHGRENWKNCKRLQTHRILHFCPDFVFPDSCLSLDEIIDRFDNETAKSKYPN